MHSYRIADITVRLDFDDSITSQLDSFAPFEAEGDEAGIIFSEGDFEIPEGDSMDSFSNDAGIVELYSNDDSYLFSISFRPSSRVHYLKCSKDFSKCLAKFDFQDSYISQVANSMVRIAFAQRILLLDGFSIHASCVVLDSRAYLFLGPSGTGKSTHSRLWLANFSGSYLLNDDNPVCRYGADGVLRAFGTPWSGKTACYKNDSAPVEAFVTLKQSSGNKFSFLHGIPAWISIFSSSSLISQDDCLYLSFEKTLNKLVESTKIAKLLCLPDDSAALLCRDSLSKS